MTELTLWQDLKICPLFSTFCHFFVVHRAIPPNRLGCTFKLLSVQSTTINFGFTGSRSRTKFINSLPLMSSLGRVKWFFGSLFLNGSKGAKKSQGFVPGFLNQDDSRWLKMTQDDSRRWPQKDLWASPTKGPASCTFNVKFPSAPGKENHRDVGDFGSQFTIQETVALPSGKPSWRFKTTHV